VTAAPPKQAAMMMRAGVLVGVALIASAGPARGNTPSDPVSLRARQERADGLTKVGEHAAAARELMEVFRVDGRVESLLAWATQTRLAGDCVLADRLYHHLLRKRVTEELAAAATAGIDRCAEAVARMERRRQVEDDPITIEDDPAPVVKPRREPASPRPAARAWFQDVGAGVLVGTGVAAAAIGFAYYRSADAEIRALPRAASHDAVTAAQHSASLGRFLGGAIGLVGSGLVAAGAIRYVLVSRRGEPQLSISTATTTTQASLILGGRF
jgi:hypothetical protein